jgi:tripartite-type tricarboxylate transporter receptor subunit TctC
MAELRNALQTGQPFVAENKPVANGIVGLLAAKSAPVDGYTLMLATTSTNAANDSRRDPVSPARAFWRSPCPKATPRPIQATLNALINAAIASPEIAGRLANEFPLTVKPLSLEQCAARDREERAKWAEYVKIARIEAEFC